MTTSSTTERDEQRPPSVARRLMLPLVGTLAVAAAACVAVSSGRWTPVSNDIAAAAAAATTTTAVSSSSPSLLRAKRDSIVTGEERTHLAKPVITSASSSHCFFRDYERVDGLPIVGDVFASADNSLVHLVVENRAGCEAGTTTQYTKDTVFDCVFEQDGTITQSLPMTNNTRVRDLKKATTFETTTATRRSRFHRYTYTISCPVPAHLQDSLPKPGAASTHAHLTLQVPQQDDDHMAKNVADYSSLAPISTKKMMQHLPICSSKYPDSQQDSDEESTALASTLTKKKKYDVALMTRIALSYKDNQSLEQQKETLGVTEPELKHWLDYHMAIGIQHFYLYNDNRHDSQDLLQEWCQSYIDAGMVTLIDYPYQDLQCDTTDDIHEQLHHRTVRMGQLVALNAALRRYQDETEWLAHWDVDEYLYLRGEDNDDDDDDDSQDIATSTQLAMAKLLEQSQDADEIEFQRPFYGPCEDYSPYQRKSFSPFEDQLCTTTDEQEFGKVMLRTATVGRAFFHYALEAIPSSRQIRTQPVPMWQGHLAHFRKGNYGDDRTYDVPSNVFDGWMTRADGVLPAVITNAATAVSLPKVLAIYFPQYHEDALNNDLWAPGFTDWVSLNNSDTRNRLGYRIPRPTKDLGYYDLKETRPRQRQGELAKEYDVDGFLYHVYWFYDRSRPGPTLAAPVEAMLQDGHPALPFAFNWCQTSWVNTWAGTAFTGDGSGTNMLQEQFFNVTDEEIQEHYEWLKPFFHHDNYIRIANQPVLFLYKHYDEAAPVLQKLRELAMQDGFAGLHLIVGRKAPPSDIFEPADNLKARLQRKLVTDVETREIVGLDAEHASQSVYNQSMTYPYPLPYVTDSYTVPHWCVHHERKASSDFDVTGLLTAFDNTPRRNAAEARIYGYGSKDKVLARFRRNLMATLFYQTCCLQYNKRADTRFVTINAWNEWGEGMSLEPSDVYGHGFLETIRDVKQEVAAMQCNAGMLPADVVGPSPLESMKRKMHNKILLDASDADMARAEAVARMLEVHDASMSMSMSFSMSMDMSMSFSFSMSMDMSMSMPGMAVLPM